MTRQRPSNLRANLEAIDSYEQPSRDGAANGVFLSTLINDALKRTRSRKRIWGILAVVAIAALATTGVTMAWITAQTDSLINTFTYGNIAITLTESSTDDGDNDATTNLYKIMPGQTVKKDPKVTVESGSEACWLFVKLDETAGFSDYLTYSLVSDWTQLKDGSNADVAGVFYHELTEPPETSQEFGVLKDNEVTAESDGSGNGLTATTMPKLTVTAYAVQHAGFETAWDAWQVCRDES